MPPRPPLLVDLPHGRAYPLHFAPLEALPGLMKARALAAGRCLLVTDAHVAAHYRARLEAALSGAGWSCRTLIVAPGEASKSMGTLAALYDDALAGGLDRATPVLALGGGVVGDLAGFGAATLLRGLPLVQVPTSLIAQVDSAIGGKTGINHAAGKNLIGAFHQPRLVCADVRLLATLPAREWTSGLAEVVKHALIADADFIDYLEAHWDALLTRDPAAVEETVYRAAAVKVKVVAADEREQGVRAHLNFGHTFGHAIERCAGYGRVTHGEAVALGMRAALYASHARHPDLPLRRLVALVDRLPAPPVLETLSTSDLLDAMRYDKKVQRGRLRLVLLRAPGAAYVDAEVPRAVIEAAWAFARGA